QDLILSDPRNGARIFPFLGGDEINDSPTHSHYRYIINFGTDSEESAHLWPDLLAILEAKAKPYRLEQKDPSARERWWQLGRYRAELYAAIRPLRRVLVCSQTSK